jgi:autotransporter-associated beta strand protein
MGSSVQAGTDNQLGRRRNAKRFLALSAATVASMLGAHDAKADTYLWTDATANSTWDATSGNWNDLTTPATGVAYVDGSAVEFNDSNGNAGSPPSTPPGTGDVVVANVSGGGGVSPSSVNFIDNSGTSGNYQFFDASGDTLGITGGTSVTLNSGYNGTVYFSAANTYTGGTFVNGGTLHINGASIGTGTLTMGGGAILYASSTTLANNIALSAGTTSTFNFSTSGADTLNGTWSNTGVGATTSNTILDITGGGAQTDTVSGPMTGLVGTIELSGDTAFFRWNGPATGTGLTGSSTALFDLGASNTGTMNIDNASGTVLLGALSGGASTTLAGPGHSGTNFNNQGEYAIGGAGLNTVFNGTITQGSERNNLVILGPGSLTLSNGSNSYSSKAGTAPAYQGPGTTILGQGQAVPNLLSGSQIPTFTSMPTASAGGTLLVSNTTGSATGVSPVFIEGATTQTGTGGTFGGDGIVSGYVSTVADSVDGATASAANYAGFSQTAGPTIAPGPAGSNTTRILTLNGGLSVGDYSNLNFSVDTTPTGTANAKIADADTTDPTLPAALALAGDGNIEVNFTFPDGNPTLGTPYTLITYTSDRYTGTGNTAASLANWLATGLPAGDAATFSDTAGTGSSTNASPGSIEVTFTAVPEPATFGLFSLGGLALLLRRREAGRDQ